jgi:hypothetical protein
MPEMNLPLPFARREDGADRGLDRGDWARRLQTVARERAGAATTVELLPAPGNGRQAGLPLLSIGYDPAADTLEIAVGRGQARHPLLRYFLAGPRRLELGEDGRELRIVVEDAQGARTLVRIGAGGVAAVDANCEGRLRRPDQPAR